MNQKEVIKVVGAVAIVVAGILVVDFGKRMWAKSQVAKPLQVTQED